MKPLALAGQWAALKESAERLRRDKRGVSAVEFAVIVPLMLVMFFGTVEFSSAVAVNRKISLVTQSLADLASRYKSVDDTDITNFTNIGNAMLTPYTSTPLQATVTELYIDPTTGLGRAQWSKGYAPRGTGSTVVVPVDLIAKDTSTPPKIIADQYLIFTEASYRYTPAVGYVMGIAGVTLSDKTFMRPRVATCVLYPTPPLNVTPPCPKS